ncbi:unnamed protein product, partial [Mesorhabditis spiculigera]
MKLLVLLGLFAVSAWASKTIPDEFLGKWVHEKDENYEEYLKKNGMNWLERKLWLRGGVTKVFAKDLEKGGYMLETRSPLRDIKYEGVQLGKQFTAQWRPSPKIKVTYDFVDGKLTENQIRFESQGAPEEHYAYHVKDGKLILEIYIGDFVARRYYKRADD